MNDLVRSIASPCREPEEGVSPETDAERLREWIVPNGLGGYASGTVCGVLTRRYLGLLIAALPAPLGRMMMLSQLSERLGLPDGSVVPVRVEAGVGGPVDSST